MEEQQKEQEEEEEVVDAGRKARETKGRVQAPAARAVTYNGASRRCAAAAASSAVVGSLDLPWHWCGILPLPTHPNQTVPFVSAQS